MNFPYVTELSMIGVADPGIANRERVIFRPTELVDLSQFGVVLGKRLPNGLTGLLPNTTIWLPDMVLAPPSWLFIYTSPGNAQTTTASGTSEFALVLHWGFSQTVFGDGSTIPVLTRIDAATIGRNPIGG